MSKNILVCECSHIEDLIMVKEYIGDLSNANNSYIY